MKRREICQIFNFFFFFSESLISLEETFERLCSKLLLKARLEVEKARLNVRKACSRCCLAKFQKSPWNDNPEPLGQSHPRLLPWLKGMTAQLLMEATVSSLLSLPLCRLDRSISLSWTRMGQCLTCMGGPKPATVPEAKITKWQVAGIINSLNLLFVVSLTHSNNQLSLL